MILSKHETHIFIAIFISITVILGTYFINRMLQKAIIKLGNTHELETQLIEVLQKLTKIFIYSLGITLSLENLHVQLSALFGTLGVIAIGVGFALQNALANMTSGIFLLYYKPFFIGDYIRFETIESGAITEGEIIEINLRYTTLQFETSKVLVPNHTLYNQVVTIIKKKS